MGLQVFGVSEEDAQKEAEFMRAASFGKNRDRSLQGSLNDLASHTPFYLDGTFNGTDESLMVVADKLSGTPHVNRTPCFAKESLEEIFGL